MSAQRQKKVYHKKLTFENFSVGDHVYVLFPVKKVLVGKDQEKVQSEKDSHSKNRDGKKN